jgi:ribonuclease Z
MRCLESRLQIMDCILLGTGGMMPMPHRLLTSLAVRLNGRIYLFDAGEGTQLGWKRAQLGLRGFTLLAVTHLHADHCLGIPGLLMLRAQMPDPEPLTIIGPPGISSFLLETQKALGFYLNYPIRFVEWSDTAEDLAYEDDQLSIFWQPLKHTQFCLGYRVEEQERPGKFNPALAGHLGIPKGPLWGRLQNGQEVTLESGRKIKPDQVLGPSRLGRHLAYVVDTRPAKAIYRLCRDVDMAFLEGMFLPEDGEHASAKGHLTVVEAANMARRAGAKRAVLIHISPRYDDQELARLEVKAKEIFDRASVARDLDRYSLPYEDE